MNYEPTLIDALRPEQLTSATQRKLPRRRLSRGALAVLVLLRAYVILAIPVVGYAFVHALHVSRH